MMFAEFFFFHRSYPLSLLKGTVMAHISTTAKATALKSRRAQYMDMQMNM